VKVNFSAEKQNKLSFAGFQHKKSALGSNEYEFNLPYDSNKYKALLEIFSVKHDGKAKFTIDKKLMCNRNGLSSLELSPNGTKINLKNIYGIDDSQSFAYRYQLVNKTNKEDTKYVLDSGSIIERDNEKYNYVAQLGTKLNKGGAMLLVLPDSYNVGFVYSEDGKVCKDENLKNRAEKSTKTFSNKLGGTLAGLEEKIPELKAQGYTRIISTPIFTDDSLSSHSYWIKNAMQMSQSLGNINNYASLQKEMFKAGMNFVADGAFVNEGLEGIHFKDVLKWGEKSPYYRWFRASGLENGPLGMGVFSKNKEFINHKIVNSPYKYLQDGSSTQVKIKRNEAYNPKKPTYIQIFDKRLASREQKEDTSSLIKAYDRLNTKNHTDINTHNDTVVPYSFIINPETYNTNIGNLNEYNKTKGENQPISLGTYQATRFLTKANTYQLEEKFEGGFEAWDANTDIAKLNFVTSAADIKGLDSLPYREKASQLKELLLKNCEVQDYAISAGKYWTKKTNDILLEYAAQAIGTVKNASDATKKINKLIDKGELPEAARENIERLVENTLNSKYKLKTPQRTSDYKELLLSGLMDLPLDSIEFGDDIVSVLGYSYITKRAREEDELGESTYSQHKKNNLHILPEAKKMYTNELMRFADEIIKEVNKKLPSDNKILDGTDAETLRKYVLPLAGQDITKFAIIKALCPQAQVKVNRHNGEISYDYTHLKNLSLKEIGINEETPEDESSAIVSKIKKGITKISPSDKKKLIDAIYDKYKNTNANSFKLSEMILDRTQSGLDWRIDASKDIADIDSIRNKHAALAETWSNVIDFWKNFTKTVRNENPNSYLVAEITDLGDLHGISGKTGRFTNETYAESAFLQETGINSTANYNYFFTDIARTFGRTFEAGWGMGDADKNQKVSEILSRYLTSAQLESLLFSYTFAGNHDKPRSLHCLALDMELFFTDFNNPKNNHHKKIAANVLNSDVESINFDTVSNKAIAMGETVKRTFTEVADENIKNPKERQQILEAIECSIADLASGNYLKTKFSPDAFGTKPFDVVIDMVLNQAQKEHQLELSEHNKELLINKTFEKMLKPAMSRLEGLMGFLVALPGNPTLFGGDELGITGYDEKCKNVYLQNRAYVNWDLLEKDNKKFLNEFYENIKKTMELRQQTELKPLNTGAPFALALQKDITGKNASGILRQNSDGSMVISIFNSTGTDYDNKKGLGDSQIVLNKISLNSTRGGNDTNGIAGGLVAGTTFKDINDKDGQIYVVCKENDSYSLRKFKNADEYRQAAKSGKFPDSKHQIKIKSPTFILYSEPTATVKPISFSGRKVLYNPQYKFASHPYQQAELPKLGEKLMANSISD